MADDTSELKDVLTDQRVSILGSDELLVDEKDVDSAVAGERLPETRHKQDNENDLIKERLDKKNTLQKSYAEQDQNEDLSDVRWESRYSAFDLLGGRTLDRRRQKADLRFMQHQAYARLLEDRILDLESKVRKICKEPPPSMTDNNSALPEMIPDIRLLAWAEFTPQMEISNKESNQWQHRAELILDPRNIIEVLQEEPRYGLSFRAKVISAPAIEPSVEPLQEGNRSKTLDTFPVGYPSLIRIRSKILIQMLQNFTGCKTKIGPHEHRLLLLQPFKLLVTYATQLREELGKLDKLHKKDANSDSKDSRHIPQTYTEPLSKLEIGPQKLTQTAESRDHLRLLCELVDHQFKSQIGLAKSLNPQMRKVSFQDLWHIFKPGSEVCTGGTRIQLYRVIKVTGGRDILVFNNPPENPASVKLKDQGYSMGSFILECFYISFDGTRFGPVNVTFQIRKFEGEKDITSFPVFPLICHSKAVEVKEKLLRRGRTFANLSNTKSTAHRKYKGPTLDRKRREYVDSEVVIDFGLAFMQEGIHRPEISTENLVDDDMRELKPPPVTVVCISEGCCGNEAVFNDYQIDETERKAFKQDYKELFGSTEDPESLIDEQMILLPPEVYGFVLRTRRWATFDIDLLTEPDYSNGWKNLVIEKSVKETVLALVENHERPHGSSTGIDSALPTVDLVEGKGKGLIILLHGEPGVGKTSTAECVAAHTRRPLFPITCGDIGEKADTVEDNLETNFQLAHKWGCVLLLDEADVFLSRRASDDIQRNAIVSVFLRTLEYYSGILFLTTNRVGKIDRAFKSRIHLTLFYPKLRLESSLRIWENNLEASKTYLERQKLELRYDREDIMSFAEEHFRELDRSRTLQTWNGRQIRNAFQTAVAIAKYETKNNENQKADFEHGIITLSRKQFDKVAQMAKNFDNYLNRLHNGKSEADLAKSAQIRVDDYVDETATKQHDREKGKSSRYRSGSSERSRSHKRRRHDMYDSDENSSQLWDSADSGRRFSRKRKDRKGYTRTR
ncbi:P-loop containing nucleoside triphosphate hydrolase protein [Penicillium herquei]|nr:P-loop containing nucleoside triphosphate hydrolase protein [Penicillium herquei]